jgi:hypothetical protein
LCHGNPAAFRAKCIAVNCGLQIEPTPFDHGINRCERGGGMDSGQQAGSIVKGVRHDRYIVDRRKRKDLAKLADAAHLGDTRLYEVDRTGGQQALEIHQRVDVLAGCDRDAARLSQRGEAIKILRGPERLLQPFQVDRFELFRRLPRLVERPRSIHVECQLDVGTGLLTGGLNGGELYLAKFERAIPCVDRLSNGGADKRGFRIADQARIAVEFGSTTAQKAI